MDSHHHEPHKRHKSMTHVHGHVLSPLDEKLLKIIRENLTSDENALPQDQKTRLEHLRVHEIHKGHEEMHAEMLLILLFATIAAQLILSYWRTKHFKSYQRVSMVGVWIIPFGISVCNLWLRFVFVWLIFTCITSIVVKKALEQTLSPTTPRQVYKWFFLLHKLCCAAGLFGYLVVIATMLGINLLFGGPPNVWLDFGLMFLFYGIYYGVLSRDLAEVCADKMAAHIGYYKEVGMPTRTLEPNMCAICGNALLVPVGEEGVIENTHRLSCGHSFHEFCIRGWCIVGKKQVCPYCKEKVDMRKLLVSPWERPHVFYGQFLDWVRLLTAWQPLVIFFVQRLNRYLGLQ